MTNRTAYAWGVCILAIGALPALVGVLRPASASLAPAVLAVDLVLGVAVLRAALAVYGGVGALGALALVALWPSGLSWDAAVWPSLVAVVQLAAVQAVMRCLLDPTAQGALAAGVAMAAAVLAAASLGEPPALGALGMAAFSLLLVGARTLTALAAERRRRVLHAAVASTALAWGVAAALLLLVAQASTLPSPDDFSALPPSFARAVAQVTVTPDGSRAALPAGALIVPGLLAAVRPWRRQRRYVDITWLLGLGCVALPLWLAAGHQDARTVLMPPLALLAGACWDARRPAWARRAATVVVVVHAVAGLAGRLALSDGVQPRPAAEAATRTGEVA